MKRLLSIIILAATLMPLFAINEILVYAKDSSGAETLVFNCWLTEKPEIIFTENGLILKNSSVEAELNRASLGYTDLSRIEFNDNPTEVLTDIPPLPVRQEAKMSFRFVDGRTVIVDGVDENASAHVFSIDGKVIPADIQRTANRMTLRLGNQPSGIYILRVNNQSFKIRKQ